MQRIERFDALGKKVATFERKTWRLKNGQEVRHMAVFDGDGVKTMSNRFVPDSRGGYKERTTRYSPNGKVFKVSRAWRANSTSFLSLTERGPGWTTSYRSADGARQKTTRERDRFGNVETTRTRDLGDVFEVDVTRRPREGKVTRSQTTVAKPRPRGQGKMPRSR